MTKSVRYQDGQLYVHHGAWLVRYRVRVQQEDGSTKLQQKAKKLGSVADFPLESQIMPLKTEFMHRLNAGKLTPESGMVLREFVDKIYLPYIEELRESTKKGYREIWNNHIRDRVGHIRMREFRTVDASKMLKAIAGENDLTKTTLQHIKSVLSGVFTHAKNEGAFDGVNPVQDARIPRNAREPCETYAYNLTQIRCVLEALPLLPKAVVATASFAGLREGELRGLEWPDYTGERTSCTGYTSIGRNPERVSDLHGKSGKRSDVPLWRRHSYGLGQTGSASHPSPGKSIGMKWYGWHGFRGGIASNLYELGADEKVVQRILRHAKSHVTKDRYIKAFDPAVLAAMRKLETSLDAISQSAPIVHQIN